MTDTAPGSGVPDVDMSIDTIRISGASPAMGKGPALANALNEALNRHLAAMQPNSTRQVQLDALRVAVRHGASVEEIAAAIAGAIGRTVRGG